MLKILKNKMVYLGETEGGFIRVLLHSTDSVKGAFKLARDFIGKLKQ